MYTIRIGITESQCVFFGQDHTVYYDFNGTEEVIWEKIWKKLEFTAETPCVVEKVWVVEEYTTLPLGPYE